MITLRRDDRDQQINKLRIEVDRYKQNIFKFDQQRFVSEEMDTDTYKRLKNHANKQIDRLMIQINDLEVTDTAFEKYTRYGMSLLKDLSWYFQEAEPQAKRKLLGSIFPGKLVFESGKYRTTKLNKAVELIGLFQKDLRNKKAGHFDISIKTFGNVARTGIEPATQGFSVFLSRFPPILLMALNQPNLPRVYRENSIFSRKY